MVNRARGPLHSFETGVLMSAHPPQGEAGGNARECCGPCTALHDRSHDAGRILRRSVWPC